MTGGYDGKSSTRVLARAVYALLEIRLNTDPKIKESCWTMDKSVTSTWPDDDLQCLNTNKSPVPKINSELISTKNVFQFPITRTNRSVLLSWRADGTNQNSETTNLWNASERLTRLSACACASLHNSYIIFSAVNQPVWHCNHGDCMFTDGRSPRMGAPPSRNKGAQQSRKQAARSFIEYPSQLPLLKHTTTAINADYWAVSQMRFSQIFKVAFMHICHCVYELNSLHPKVLIQRKQLTFNCFQPLPVGCS